MLAKIPMVCRYYERALFRLVRFGRRHWHCPLLIYSEGSANSKRYSSETVLAPYTRQFRSILAGLLAVTLVLTVGAAASSRTVRLRPVASVGATMPGALPGSGGSGLHAAAAVAAPTVGGAAAPPSGGVVPAGAVAAMSAGGSSGAARTSIPIVVPRFHGLEPSLA